MIQLYIAHLLSRLNIVLLKIDGCLMMALFAESVPGVSASVTNLMPSFHVPFFQYLPLWLHFFLLVYATINIEVQNAFITLYTMIPLHFATILNFMPLL